MIWVPRMEHSSYRVENLNYRNGFSKIKCVKSDTREAFSFSKVHLWVMSYDDVFFCPQNCFKTYLWSSTYMYEPQTPRQIIALFKKYIFK